MTTHLKQPTSTPVMIAAARRALNADRAYLQADNVVRCDRFADFDGEERFQAVQFARGGAVTTGWRSPNRD